ncbi:MAG: cytochrome c [Acidobacteriota bacterium]|nr:cytochrome c [Acidobacteriota bacterium]
MRYSLSILTLFIASVANTTALAQEPSYNVGRTPTSEELHSCCVPITTDGTGLPPGSGTAQQGASIFAQKCASCHGATGREGPWDTLVAEDDTALRKRFFTTSIWDFIYRYMPPVKRNKSDEGGLLSHDEVYALTAFLLHQNRIIGETEIMDAQSLPQIHLPKRPSDDPRFQDYLP